MPVNAYTDFASNMSGFDEITNRAKAAKGNLRALEANKKAIDATNSMSKQYENAIGQIIMGKSQTFGGGSFGGGGGGGPVGDIGGGGPNGPGKMDSFLRSIRTQESGGRYHLTNGIGATGAYQVMPANIPSWTKQALGRSVSRSKFLSSRDIQDKVARYILTGYVKKYGYGGAAAAWYGGPRAGSRYASGVRNTSRQRGGPSIAKYVQQVLSRM